MTLYFLFFTFLSLLPVLFFHFSSSFTIHTCYIYTNTKALVLFPSLTFHDLAFYYYIFLLIYFIIFILNLLKVGFSKFKLVHFLPLNILYSLKKNINFFLIDFFYFFFKFVNLKMILK
jgi:hypothetical protein